jgi:hypothetical protein
MHTISASFARFHGDFGKIAVILQKLYFRASTKSWKDHDFAKPTVIPNTYTNVCFLQQSATIALKMSCSTRPLLYDMATPLRQNISLIWIDGDFI